MAEITAQFVAPADLREGDKLSTGTLVSAAISKSGKTVTYTVTTPHRSETFTWRQSNVPVAVFNR